MANNARLFGSARLITICTLASRVTGLVRDIVLNRAYGQGGVQDAFNYGFLIPNLFRRLFGEGALSAVFVPVFTDVLDSRGRPVAWLLLGRVTGLMAVALAILTIVVEGIVLAVWGFSLSDRSLHIGLTAVMAPFMIGICVLALFSSILNCLNHFSTPALLPIVLNVMIIAGIALVGPMLGGELDRQVYGTAFCVLAAGIIQLAIILPVLRRHGVRFRPTLDTRDPDVRRILRTFLPILIGQGVLLFNAFFDFQICTYLTGPTDGASNGSFFGSSFEYPLEAGALSAVANAQRLYQFPLGVLAIALATAALPMFSRHASRGEVEGLRTSVSQALRLALYEGLPSGLIMMVLASPIVSLLFEHGRFGPDQTARAAYVLQFYGIGMWAFCAQHILLRAFYSLKDTLTPMWISCGLVILNWSLNLTLVWSLRESAFAISTSVTAVLHVVISVWFLRRRMGGRMGATEIAGSVARIVPASALACVAAWLLLRGTNQWFGADVDGLVVRGCRVFVPLLGSILVYLGSTRLMRMEEPNWLLGSVSKAGVDRESGV